MGRLPIPLPLAFVTMIAALLGTMSPRARAGQQTTGASIQWQPWSDGVFAEAKRQNKFVLLDLQAVWCHWCHVMDQVTYRDPDVIRLIRDRYIAVKVDQDSRPDLSNRYEDYGWPATVVFNSDGGEIVKRQGYLPPGPMARMLQAIIDDPSPGPSVRAEKPIRYVDTSSLEPALKKELESRLEQAFDPKRGGWGAIHKFVDWDATEYAIARARDGDPQSARQARLTLASGLKLIDPVWGGVYQYSVEGDWDHPHFEKLMQFQAEEMRIYALGFAAFSDPNDRTAAESIHLYMNRFLRSSDGAYYVSQDADLREGEYADQYFALNDTERRRRGLPRVDTHCYARENGWAIRALADLYQWTRDPTALEDALRAAEWVMKHEGLESGGFRHGEQNSGGPYLADSLAMGRGFLELYQVTADRSWLDRACKTADFLSTHFGRGGDAGLQTVASSPQSSPSSKPQVDENVAVARFFNLLSQYTGKSQYKETAGRAMRFLATPDVARQRGFFVAGILLADRELDREPLHVSVVGRKSDPAARDLFSTALLTPDGCKRIEWWDESQGPLPNPDVRYPRLKSAAAFLCANGACSSPIAKPETLAKKLGGAFK